MKRKVQHKPAHPKEGLVIRLGNGAPLSRTQVEFNRLMKSLEATKARHAREQARLDEVLATSIRELMPLIEDINRLNRDLVFSGFKAFQTLKLTAERRRWFGDLLSGKATELLADPVGLSAEEISELEAVVEELGPDEDDERMTESESDEFNFVRTMMEQAAREAGLDLDLGDLDPNGDPEEFERIASERLRDAFENRAGSPSADAKPRRKPTKAQAEKERKRLEQEDAKNRDLKSLFKQLAKAFHPDLEPEPLLKEHKKVWMQRLNSAYAANDLREMLQLEMEWLGEEATNLATAGDQKLQVYCMVLKEQIDDLKLQTHYLPNEPQYGPLQRFRDPFYGTIANPKSIKRELQDDLRHYREMLEILTANNAASRRMIYDWADEHARRAAYPF
ncbi:MAG: hypothetical protein ABIS50_10635 [Luteolibacter sp.]|uniref:hypothetical protein n=1 Tax=Luteolibacter sp. TaxID=1962973 RepID=UPI0032652740